MEGVGMEIFVWVLRNSGWVIGVSSGRRAEAESLFLPGEGGGAHGELETSGNWKCFSITRILKMIL
jgi:hypothetical protein